MALRNGITRIGSTKMTLKYRSFCPRKTAYAAWLADPKSGYKREHFVYLRKTAQTHLRRIQNDWWRKKADDLQQYADKHDSQSFCDALKAVYGPKCASVSPLKAADGSQLITDEEAILSRCREHFDALLNRPSAVKPGTIEGLQQAAVAHELDNIPSKEEISKAIHQTQSGKAPGPDSIPAEIFKVAESVLLDRLLSLFSQIWETEKLPQDFKNAQITTIYKKKGERSDCNNYRGISLLAIAGKILARFLLNRMAKQISDPNLSESQTGFRANRGTTDCIFAARQLQKKCKEQNCHLYAVFFDLTKAFDTVN